MPAGRARLVNSQRELHGNHDRTIDNRTQTALQATPQTKPIYHPITATTDPNKFQTRTQNSNRYNGVAVHKLNLVNRAFSFDVHRIPNAAFKFRWYCHSRLVDYR